MRDYGKISPKFWTQGTGKVLRGHPEAQIVAVYLMTCPTSEMTGVFHCPLLYMAHETGLGMEGASKGLARLIELDFCTYEEASEMVFVHEMAKYQIGDELKPDDKRVKGLQKSYDAMQGSMKSKFYERYAKVYHLHDASPLEAPPKPRTGTGTGTRDIPAKTPKSKKTPMPEDFKVSERVIAWASEKGYGNLQAHFENFASAVRRNGYTYVDWDEALMEAIRKDWAKLGPLKAGADSRFKGAK